MLKFRIAYNNNLNHFSFKIGINPLIPSFTCRYYISYRAIPFSDLTVLVGTLSLGISFEPKITCRDLLVNYKCFYRDFGFK